MWIRPVPYLLNIECKSKRLSWWSPKPQIQFFKFNLYALMGKGVQIMERTDVLQKKVRIICPECSNYINGKMQTNGSVAGQCPVCKSVVVSKQCTPKEKQIRIIKCSN